MADNSSIAAAQRVVHLPPYLFAEMDRKKREAIRAGRDVIDLGVGDPDRPTPEPIVRRLQEAVLQVETHRYPSYDGLPEFREAIARWFEQRYGVVLDPHREVLVLIGSKEGLGHLPWALLDPGDMVLIPDPAYPVYETGTLLAGGKPCSLPLFGENRYLPDLDSVSADMARRVKLLYLNYPNNPTGAVADATFFEKAVEWALNHKVIVCNDAAYAEIAFDGFRPPSLLSIDGAKNTAVEFHSLSKTFNMTGWRVGFAVGNADILRALGEIKKNVDSGVFTAVQYAGMEALNHYADCIEDICRIYRTRRDILVDGLLDLGWKVEKPLGTFYVWAKVPAGQSSSGFAAQLLESAAISVVPGNGFGPHGEGYVRFALTVGSQRIEEAVERIRKM